MGNNYETIILKKENGIATIILNRPEKRNALNLKIFQELTAVMGELATDTTARVIVITGMGKAFCAGGDLDLDENPVFSLKTAEKVRSRFRELHQLLLAMRRLEKPLIASINGPAMGAGMDLALACDIRIAAETAFFSEAYAKIGALPDTGGTYFLPRVVGVAKACELIFTGDTIDGKEAERIGLVSKVVPLDKLEETTMELATKLAKGPTAAIGLAKSLIYNGLNSDLSTALDEMASSITICFQTKDLQEGLAAFQEKRSPVFTGE